MRTFEILYIDIDDREGDVYDTWQDAETAQEACDRLVEDHSGSGYVIEIIAVNEK